MAKKGSKDGLKMIQGNLRSCLQRRRGELPGRVPQGEGPQERPSIGISYCILKCAYLKMFLSASAQVVGLSNLLE